MTDARRTAGTPEGRVVVDLSVSLDGFVAGPDDRPERALGEGGERLHAWIFGGDVPNDSQPFFKPVERSRRIVDEWSETVGALLTGRRTFDLVDGWGGNHPLGVPIVVLTHRPPPAGQEHEGTTFVSDGIESALSQAKAAADRSNVWIHGASVAQQCLRAGLLDELQLHVVPVLLGGGVRLFGEDGAGPVDLRHVRTVDSDGVTHLRYEVREARPHRPLTGGNDMPNITPHLWFDDQAEEAARFYTAIFPNSRVLGEPARYDEAMSEASGRDAGTVMTISFELDGQRFVALNGGPHFAFSEAISFIVDCKDQEEVDYYWEALGAGGDANAQQCGWLKDRFGVSWQVVPSALHELLADPDPEAAKRVSQAMLNMKKIDIAGLRQARDAAA